MINLAESISVSVKSRSGGKIYLDGSACGDSGKQYCIEYTYPSGGIAEEVKNSNYNYTFFSGGGCLGLSSSGCYITDYGDGYYGIILKEVDIYGCDYFIDVAAHTSIDVSTEPDPIPTCNLTAMDSDNLTAKVFVEVDPGTGGSWSYHNPYIEWEGGSWKYNVMDGIYTYTYGSSGTYLVKLFAINSDYKSCVDSVYVTVKEECPTTVYVFDTEANDLPYSNVTIDEITKSTGSDHRVDFDLDCNKTYTATASKTGYRCSTTIGKNCSETFTTPDEYIYLFLEKESIIPDFIISGPKNVVTGTPFDVRITGAKASSTVTIKHESTLLDTVIGQGTADSNGNATISCTIKSDGEYTVYGYSYTYPTRTVNNIYVISSDAAPTTCADKTQTECNADPDCYWWDSDNAGHDTPEPTTYPTLTITSDMDALSGLDAYVDGTRRGVTPITISFTESDIGGVVNVAGVFAGIMGTRDEEVTLKAGSNEVGIELLMDNKEILVGGTVAGILAISYAA